MDNLFNTCGEDLIMSDFKFEIIRELGILSDGTKGWHKEVNLVSWNGHSTKLDIRDWGPDHGKIGKGVTINNQEFKQLKDILNNLEWEKE
jgi:hypothetical protein